MVKKLDDKVALITGAGSGIGRASSVLLAREGARVGVVDNVIEGAEETVRLIKNTEGEAIAIKADVSVVADVENMINTVVDAYGRLDILFNNAGISAVNRAFTAELSVEDWDTVININLRGVFLGCKFAIPHLLKNGRGSIISTSSVNGLRAATTIAPYCASKAAVINLMRTVAAEYGQQGIRANAICPGVIETGMTTDFVPFFDFNFIGQGRAGQPEEIAQTVLFLASDDSSYLTGAAIPVDGGWSAEFKIPMNLPEGF
ncbi:SDR family NAD(P)-dependent oxidoreductase [Neptuniibacter sp.]|uniref:SDR family NAD(P)-dependent oxidoreductase n=1 Tax=Neptuniibacter sp. TaxID=1962643 RepID=UPI002638111E|nr:SDR family NAD(P)-dependent oxidoreductase [Neptuniibacter sp.]MCP4595994.1 SDR family oxidoreductase [Neptuniibacter sp.]